MFLNNIALGASLLFLLASAASGQDFSAVEIKPTRVADGLYMLAGQGGNIGVSAGEDGVFMIDDQFAPLSAKIQAVISQISDRPVKFVLNTHWHGDHTGGNESFGKAGAVLVAHENVRKRLSTGQFQEFFNRQVPPAPYQALPVVTFTRDLTFHLNGDEVAVFHVDPAHTDGDAIVYFKQANVMHVGDIFFNGIYPFIDLSSGGSVTGVIDAVDRVLSIANDSTRLIPGHGPLSRVAELKAYRNMLATIRDRIGKEIVAGKTLDDIVAARPTEEFDAEYGDGFVQPDQFVGIVYKSLTMDRRPGD